MIDALLSTCPIVYSIELFRVKRSRDIETSRLMLMSHRMLQHCYLIRYNACEYAKPNIKLRFEDILSFITYLLMANSKIFMQIYVGVILSVKF